MASMAPFADFAALCAGLVATSSRLGKRRLVAEYLRARWDNLEIFHL